MPEELASRSDPSLKRERIESESENDLADVSTPSVAGARYSLRSENTIVFFPTWWKKLPLERKQNRGEYPK